MLDDFIDNAAHLTVHDGGEAVHLVHHHQVLQGAGREEKRISLLYGHGTAELWLIVIVAQVGDLVQVAETIPLKCC